MTTALLMLLAVLLGTATVASLVQLRHQRRARLEDKENARFVAGTLEFQWKRAQEHVRELYEQAGRTDVPHWADPCYSPWE